MRRKLASVALLAALAAAACTDTPPTGATLRDNVGGPLLNQESLGDYVDRLVIDLFPKGLETATGSRWATVKDKLEQGDFAGATKHLRDLATWVKKKTPEITLTPEFSSKEHAAASLAYAMAIYVYNGPTSATPKTGGDVAFAVVPAGEAATIVTPSGHAAVDIETGSTNEDRIVTVIQDPALYPGHCNGPLPTNLCQYPLFYDIASFPSDAFNKVVGVSVCAVTTGDRSPLDNPTLAPPANEEVHDRLRLARPYKGGARTPNSTLVGEIEVLPRRTIQKGLTNCDDIATPLAVNTIRGGWLGRAQRGMLAIANFAGRALTPKNLYAYDSGPEHETIGFGSPINAVDPASQPDLGVTAVSSSAGEAFGGDAVSVTYSAENKSRRSGGHATAASEATSAAIYLFSDAGLTEQVAGPLGTAQPIPALRPDAAPHPVTQSVTLPDNIPLNQQYFIGPRVTPNPGLTETDALDESPYANNTRAVPILVKNRNEQRRQGDIAIYKNYNAWFGSNKDETVLQGAPFNFSRGAGYVVRPMSGLTEGIPAATSLIIITSASSGNASNQITEQRAGAENLDAWVRAGGWLVIHAGDNGADDYIVPGLSGPVDEMHNCTGATLTVANHALIRGPDATLGTGDDLNNTNVDNGGRFCSDNHGSLQGLLPANADVLMTEQGGAQRPVYATYTLGSGRVIVLTLTVEFSAHTTQTLINHFHWAINGLNPLAASSSKIASLTPSLSASGSDEVTVNTDGSPRP